MFSLNLTLPDYNIFAESSKSWDPSSLLRTTQGITSILLALKKKPLIRYEANSLVAKKLASEIAVRTTTLLELIIFFTSMLYKTKVLCMILEKQIQHRYFYY